MAVDKAALKEQMYRAIVEKDADAIFALAQQGAPINIRDAEHGTPLHVAAEVGRIDLIDLLFAKGIKVWTEKDGVKVYVPRLGGENPLHAAGTIEAASLLLKYGIGVDSADSYKQTRLYTLVLGGDEEKAKLLTGMGFKVTARNRTQLIAEHGVRLNELLDEMAEVLIEAKADVNKSAHGGVTSLHNVRSLKMAGLLIARGGQATVPDKEGYTPLHKFKNLEIADLFLAHGADIDSPNKDGQTPIFFARDVVEAEFFVKNKADIRARDKRKSSPLYGAVRAENVELVRYYAGLGLGVDEKREAIRGMTHTGYPPGYATSLLWEAAHAMKSVRMVELLVSLGAKDTTIRDELLPTGVRELVQAANALPGLVR